MTDDRVWRAAGIMSLGTALSRITGLIRVAALTYALGVTGTRLADTYNLANTTPNIVYELFLGGILTSVFVPVLIDAKQKKEGDASALVSVSLLALAVVSAVAAVAAPLVMRIYTFRVPDPTARAAQLELATFLLRWFAPQIFFYGLAAIAQALLNVRGRFGPAAFAPVLNNLVVTATLIGYGQIVAQRSLHLDTTAKTLLGAGTTAGVVIQAAVLLPLLRTERLRFRVRLRDPAVRRVVRLAAYVIGYVVVNQVGLWVVLALANEGPGGVTAWQVAFIFFQLPHGLFAVSLQTALFPDLARAASLRDWAAYRRGVATGLRGVVYLLLPAALGYVLLAQPITRLIIARGVSDATDAAVVADVLQVFAVGLVPFAAFHLFTRSFYALPDTRTPAALNSVAVGLNIAVAFPLYSAFGVPGLALGHAIAYTAGATILAAVLRRRIPDGLGLRAIVVPVLRMTAGAAVMTAVVWVLSRALSGDVVEVATGVGAGALVYLALTRAMGAEEPSLLAGLLVKRHR